MSQSKRHSVIETATNTAVGFVGSYLITYACFHIEADLATKTLYATLGCTAWSLIRGYYLRRFFNYLHTKQAAEPWGDLQSYDRPMLCPHGEKADSGCSECREGYLQMRRDDRQNYENRG